MKSGSTIPDQETLTAGTVSLPTREAALQVLQQQGATDLADMLGLTGPAHDHAREITFPDGRTRWVWSL
ncbi:MAG TPA: hypothetical protein PLY19_09495 [Rhodoglobus sp.]|nr:hypothetical protein [Rhodoglobus sp.]